MLCLQKNNKLRVTLLLVFNLLFEKNCKYITSSFKSPPRLSAYIKNAKISYAPRGLVRIITVFTQIQNFM